MHTTARGGDRSAGMPVARLSPNDPTSRVREHDDDERTPTRATRMPHDARLAAVIDRLPASSDHTAYLAAITPPDPRVAGDDQIRARLDACRDHASGPYAVNGQ